MTFFSPYKRGKNTFQKRSLCKPFTEGSFLECAHGKDNVTALAKKLPSKPGTNLYTVALLGESQPLQSAQGDKNTKLLQ